MEYRVQHINTCAEYQNPNTPKESYSITSPNLANRRMKYIDELRKDKHMTVEQVCEKALITQSHYYACKSGTKNPSKYCAIAIATAFELTLTDTILLLYNTGFHFDCYDRTDILIMNMIERKIYDVQAMNDNLVQNGFSKVFDRKSED